MDTKILVKNLVAWLKQQVEKTGAKGLLVGVSGGIDSAVVANLIKRACPENSLGVIIPISSSESSVEDAKKLIDCCGIKSVTVDLTQQHRQMLEKSLEGIKSLGLFKEEYLQISDANLRARLRMSSLYTIANNLGYMVVGTDNKDETYTGYFTKYGDGAVDLQPLKMIYKSQVYEMAKVLDVPEEIIQKKPSADLWENQTDEDEMGVKYSVIEDYIKGKKVSLEDQKKIRQLHEKSKHKRAMPPFYEI